MSLLALCAACSSPQKLIADGRLFDRPLQTEVDSELAQTMLADRQNGRVAGLFAKYGDSPLNNSLLEHISNEYSLDVSTLFFAEKLYANPSNKRLQDYYLEMLDSPPSETPENDVSFLKDFFIVFIPVFNYESNSGNFLEQRELFDSTQIPYTMIRTKPWGSMAENAKTIADNLLLLNDIHKNIIVISASKGSPEVARALASLSLPSVKAWINVCGILKGSPVADYWAMPKKKFWLTLALFFANKRLNLNDLLIDLSYERQKDGALLIIPESIYTINLIALNFSRKDKVKMRVPNDGYSPLLDEISPGGDVVMEAGIDHQGFGSVNMNGRMVALLRWIVGRIGCGRGG